MYLDNVVYMRSCSANKIFLDMCFLCFLGNDDFPPVENKLKRNKIDNYVIRYESTTFLQIKLMHSLNPFGNLKKIMQKLINSLNIDNYK